MVTGGWDEFDRLESTEVLDSILGSWATSGAKLPQSMSGLRATNIDGRVLIFGNYEQAKAVSVCLQVILCHFIISDLNAPHTVQ